MLADGYRYKIATAKPRGARIVTLPELLAERGAQQVGVCNRRGVREELRGQPTFADLAGPMWDGLDDEGHPIIRYEDQSSFERLSI